MSDSPLAASRTPATGLATERLSQASRSLGSDERGAMMIVALFMAVFLVGILYYAVGVGQAVMRRESLQDMADTTALSAAVAHARGMNFIVLLNIVMAALLTILVTIRLIQGLCIIGMVIATALAAATWGGSLALVPPLKAVESQMQATYELVEPPVHLALELLHTTADYVSTATPQIARAVAEPEHPDSIEIVVAPLAESLPVRDDSFDRLCGLAGGFAMNVYMKPLEVLPGFDYVAKALSAAVQAITKLLADWFCGDSEEDSEAPSYSVENDDEISGILKEFGAEDCRAGDTLELGDDEKPETATSTVCAEAETLTRKSLPDPLTGACSALIPEAQARTDAPHAGEPNDCQPGGPYDRRAALARENCAPTARPAPQTYQYQIRPGRVTYTWTGQAWQRGTPEYSEPTLQPSPPDQIIRTPPCGTKGATYSEDYNLKLYPDGDPTRTLPVCSSEEPPGEPAGGKRRTGFTPPETVEFVEVLNILGCTRTTTHTQTFDAGGRMHDSSAGGDDAGDVGSENGEDSEEAEEGNEKAPKTIIEETQMGDEVFQLRAFVLAESPRSYANAGVRFPLWGQDAPEHPAAPLVEHGRFAFAQAEFYFDGDTNPDDWMWSMRWRARLRVFRLEAGPFRAAEQACAEQAPDESCRSAFDSLETFDGLLAH